MAYLQDGVYKLFLLPQNVFPLTQKYCYFIHSYTVTITLCVQCCLHWYSAAAVDLTSCSFRTRLFVLILKSLTCYDKGQRSGGRWRHSRVRYKAITVHVALEVKSRCISFCFIVELINLMATTFCIFLRNQYLVRLRTVGLLVNNIIKHK